MSIKHYYNFGTRIHNKLGDQKLGVSGWEMLRTTGDNKDFMIEQTRKTWIYNCKKNIEYQLPARAITKYCIDNMEQLSQVVSMGIGKGILEWYLIKELNRKKCNLNLVCLDNTSKAIEKLKKIFWECDNLGVFDMLNGDWTLIEPQSLIVLYRLSTEFSTKQWSQVFEEMHKVGVEKIVFVPTDVLRVKDYLIDFKEKIIKLMNKNKKKDNVFCGWRYSENEFRRMWKPYYKEKYSEKAGEMRIYYLEIIR